MNTKPTLDIADEIALMYPMRYNFPELDEHWGETLKRSSFVTADIFEKAYARIRELELLNSDLLDHGKDYRQTIKRLEHEVKELSVHQCFDLCWISVDQTLPAIEEVVMCCLKSDYDGLPKYQFMFRADQGEIWTWCDHHGDEDDYLVTHWVPLPATPEIFKGQNAEVW